MKQRCNNPNVEKYSLYGGRGITYCDEWEEFKAFEEWAYKNGYREYLTLDRIDINGNYCPENCRWATYQEQANNTRVNHLIEIDGEKRSIAEWAGIYGMPYSTFRNKVYRLEKKGVLQRIS